MIRHDKPKRKKSYRKNQDKPLTAAQLRKVEQLRQMVSKVNNGIPVDTEIR